jgi:hypothetical protein
MLKYNDLNNLDVQLDIIKSRPLLHNQDVLDEIVILIEEGINLEKIANVFNIPLKSIKYIKKLNKSQKISKLSLF